MVKHSNLSWQVALSDGLGQRLRFTRVPGTRIRRLHQVSDQARVRLRCIEFANRHSVALAADAFDVPRSTIYRWVQRYDPNDLRTLEPRSRRPHRTRWKQWTPAKKP